MATLVVVILLGWFVWPTPWTYDEEVQEMKSGDHTHFRIRHHRLTGEKQTLMNDGWHHGSVIID